MSRKEGVVEIECPYCHSRIVPKKRFSSLTFAGLMIIGLIPFLVFLVLNSLAMIALPSLLGTAMAGVPFAPTGMEGLVWTLYSIMIPTSIAVLLLILIIGIIPATIYWSVRRDTYKCPVCGMKL